MKIYLSIEFESDDLSQDDVDILTAWIASFAAARRIEGNDLACILTDE